MAEQTQLLYLEPDDEITTVVRRLREADAPRVALVASGRTKATTSAVALRLLAQVAAEEQREVVLVADAAARALAAEAGIPAFASVAEANAEGAVPIESPPARRAAIHVVRGEAEPAAPELAPVEHDAAGQVAALSLEETQAVPVQRPDRYPVPAQPPPAQPRSAPAGQRAAPVRRTRFTWWVIPAAALLLLVAVGAALATVVPAATVVVHPRAAKVGPLSYTVRPEMRAGAGTPLTSTKQGEATGHRTVRTFATGVILLINYSDENVTVPSGTTVSVHGEVLFQTTQAVTVPDSFFGFVGTANAPIRAVERGPGGNVDANAIDTIEDRDVDRRLRGQGPDDRRVRNDDPTSGGDERELLVVRKSDITAVTDAIRADLEQQLASQRGESVEARIYPQDGAPKATIEVPKDLEGHESADPFTFELTGTLTDDQAYVLRSDAVALATARALQDPAATPSGRTLDEESIRVEVGGATLQGDRIEVMTQVTAQAAPQYDPSAIAGRIGGMTADGARSALSSIGPADVTFWPFWVDRVPSLDWRVKVDVEPVESAAQ